MEKYKFIPNIKDVDLENLCKGESVKCSIKGTQGVDGSQFSIVYDSYNNCYTVTRIESN